MSEQQAAERDRGADTQLGCSDLEAWLMHSSLEGLADFPELDEVRKLGSGGDFDSYLEALEYMYETMLTRASEGARFTKRIVEPPSDPVDDEPF